MELPDEDLRCWECRELTAGSICTREHPNFSLVRALANGHISSPVMGNDAREKWRERFWAKP